MSIILLKPYIRLLYRVDYLPRPFIPKENFPQHFVRFPARCYNSGPPWYLNFFHYWFKILFPLAKLYPNSIFCDDKWSNIKFFYSFLFRYGTFSVFLWHMLTTKIFFYWCIYLGSVQKLKTLKRKIEIKYFILKTEFWIYFSFF